MTNKSMQKYRFNLFVIVGVAVSMLALTGCQPLKKKFTRKKSTEQKDKFVPVLDPIDYGELTHTADHYYSQSYNLWKVWQKDFIYNLEKNSNEKNLKFLLNKIIVELTKMRDLLVESSQEDLSKIIESYQNTVKTLERPVVMRDNAAIIRRVESYGKKVRLNYSPRLLDTNLYVDGGSSAE